MKSSDLPFLFKVLAATIVLNVALVLGLAVPFRHLWNWSLGPVSTLPRISYWDAAALLGIVWIVARVARGVGAWIKIDRSSSPVLRQLGL